MKRTFLLTCALMAVAAVGTAQQPERIPQIRFTEYRLPNGLRVILSPDHAAPVVAVSVTYNVGSRNERPGRAGFAHLFEHLMFQGSRNVGKGELMMLVQDNGGTFNGTTNQDRTQYFEELPANQLELALFLESDRMRSLDISQVNMDNQRAVVEEEKRQSYDNQPYGKMDEVVHDLTYADFPYKHTTIGSVDDLNAATIQDVRAFFKTNYAPNNACIAVVGDFAETTGRRLVEKYFGDIPRQPDPPPVEISEPPASGEKRKEISDPLARLTRMEIAYKTVPGNDPDAYALTVLGSILSSGRTSRLYTHLVETRIALSAFAGGQMGRGPSLFSFNAMIPPGGSADAVEKAWDDEVARVQTAGVTPEELKKAQRQAVAREVVGGRGGGRGGGGGGFGLRTALGRANALTQNAIFFDDAGRVNTLLTHLLGVTAADVQRVANKYLLRDNRVVVIDAPQESPDDLIGSSLPDLRRRGAL